MRLAPAEKFTAWLATTMASKSGVQALHAGLDHGGDVVADGVHLGVKFAAEHAVAEIDEAGAGIFARFPWSDP